MKKYFFLFLFASGIFTVDSLSAQTYVAGNSNVTVLKRANPDYKEPGNTDISKHPVTAEKAQNPNDQKKETTEQNEKILITEKRSKNPK